MQSSPLAGKIHRIAQAIASILLLSALGCASNVGSAKVANVPTTIVLTFDDGPFPPDVSDPVATAADANLLDPLRDILAALRGNHAQAVFYLVGPDDTADTPEFRELYSQALREMHTDGHVLGYHAYHHTRDIWARAFEPFTMAVEDMSRDMDQLSQFLDETLATIQLTRDEVMSPIFRQPYGGGGFSQGPAFAAARDHGWFYHGLHIDSADWTVNLDAGQGLVHRLPVATEGQHVAFVLRQLHHGHTQNTGRRMVDVLFHVNHFTAAHIQEWIDALRTDFTTAAGEPLFVVPQSYLDHSDSYADPSVTEYAFGFHRY
ncbi:MAG: polysaccharide deacetylase family protein [Planctomycetes bacterium]|nr:polysaccharide deacetylase family protein [Planctomycetota bacterium]MBI3835936.1 polysaccharide deacetylase family protein [Planctomycetota bacterium]